MHAQIRLKPGSRRPTYFLSFCFNILRFDTAHAFLKTSVRTCHGLSVPIQTVLSASGIQSPVRRPSPSASAQLVVPAGTLSSNDAFSPRVSTGLTATPSVAGQAARRELTTTCGQSVV
jgi:hypothetical protein